MGGNLVVADAFSEHPLSGQKFDAVVGNPPWASRLTEAASKWLQTERRTVADKQIAEAFVWLADSHLADGGKLALVLPAKAVLHNRSRPAVAFRTEMFADIDVETVVDLSAIRKGLFAQAVAPAAVIVARKKSGDDATPDDVLHLAPHPRTHADSVDALVVVPEEVRLIPRSLAHTRPELWKVLLWGSQRDLELVDHLRRRAPSVGDVAKQRGWVTGQGFQVAGGDANDASPMRGLPVLAVGSLGTLEVDGPPATRFEYESLHRPRSILLYQAPVAVIARTFKQGRITAALLTENTAFNNAMIGLAAPASDTVLLCALVATVTSSLGHYWHFLTSSSWGVERDFVELNEHLGLPLGPTKK